MPLIQHILSEDLLWLECILRFFIALVLGFSLGVERQIRLKVAGIRIHVVVAAGAALFTIVSSFGFASDTSRVAAQVVTGIGFIGAGTIMHRQNAVHGLTSAAGVWLTAAVGMAAGAGMYIMALSATVLTVLVQLFMHLPLRLFSQKHQNEIKISFKSPTEDCAQTIKNIFGITRFTEFKAERIDGELVYNAVLHTKKVVDVAFVSKMINDHDFIISVEKAESDR